MSVPVMNSATVWQLALYLVVLVALVKPLGTYMAQVFSGGPAWAERCFGWLERSVYRLAGINSSEEMNWRTYAGVLLALNAVAFVFVYGLQRLQGFLPANPQKFAAIGPTSAFNTAVSFMSNTNWQGYGGESTMSYLTQMLALASQNFLSAATGIAALIALIRGFSRTSSATVGNAWSDFTRSITHILLPLSCVLALVLVSQGVVQTFAPYKTIELAEAISVEGGEPVTQQTIPLGPAASQIAIKQLGTNGGGFFNVNSAHPLENPTPLSNFLQVLSILLIPAALCYTFGVLVGDIRQGWAVLIAMLVVFVACLIPCVLAEQQATPMLVHSEADIAASDLQAGGNMEGKEVRFGIGNSALWAVATTAASNGSVNSMHDSFTPLGGIFPLLLMQLGEVIFGGVGSGLYGMLIFAIVTVFLSGLMIGRTPEYLGKKIESFEVKMASIAILTPVIVVLVGTAIAVVTPDSIASRANPGAHGFSEILYAFSSAGNNNGSAFAGLNANTPFYNVALGVVMFIARFWVMIPALAIAGSLAAKKHVPESAGTFPTHGVIFVVLLVSVIVIVCALSYIPALALGPIVEHLQMGRV
jgi:K+-transporting ATPase ATPase A chain